MPGAFHHIYARFAFVVKKSVNGRWFQVFLLYEPRSLVQAVLRMEIQTLLLMVVVTVLVYCST